MQIVQDVTPPEFGRLLGKKLVLSLPYYKLAQSKSGLLLSGVA